MSRLRVSFELPLFCSLFSITLNTFLYSSSPLCVWLVGFLSPIYSQNSFDGMCLPGIPSHTLNTRITNTSQSSSSNTDTLTFTSISKIRKYTCMYAHLFVHMMLCTLFWFPDFHSKSSSCDLNELTCTLNSNLNQKRLK